MTRTPWRMTAEEPSKRQPSRRIRRCNAAHHSPTWPYTQSEDVCMHHHQPPRVLFSSEDRRNALENTHESRLAG